MLDNYMTVKEAMDWLQVSRQTIYEFARRYSWDTAKVGNTRLYTKSSVEGTPDKETRKIEGYQRRELHQNA